MRRAKAWAVAAALAVLLAAGVLVWQASRPDGCAAFYEQMRHADDMCFGPPGEIVHPCCEEIGGAAP
jgi:hypothetical protein